MNNLKKQIFRELFNTYYNRFTNELTFQDVISDADDVAMQQNELYNTDEDEVFEVYMQTYAEWLNDNEQFQLNDLDEITDYFEQDYNQIKDLYNQQINKGVQVSFSQEITDDMALNIIFDNNFTIEEIEII